MRIAVVAARHMGEPFVTREHRVTSGGIGCSVLPVRFRVVPEITLVTLTA
ncbi:hypothetical protein [Arenibacterium sp. CAU 1754]